MDTFRGVHGVRILESEDNMSPAVLGIAPKMRSPTDSGRGWQHVE